MNLKSFFIVIILFIKVYYYIDIKIYYQIIIIIDDIIFENPYKINFIDKTETKWNIEDYYT